MILVETSAWVEFDRATGSPVDVRLTELIANESDLASTEPVMMEVLAGAKDDRSSQQLRRLLTSFGWIPAEVTTDFEGAARIYRLCRAAGVTPRGLLDCMISSIALRAGATLLTSDRDFRRIATVVPLLIDPASTAL